MTDLSSASRPVDATEPVTFAALHRDPYPLLADLRERAPVHWSPAMGMWLVTRRDLVLEVLRDPEAFTVERDDSPIRDTFGHHMLSTDGERQRMYKSRCAPPFNARAVRDDAGPVVEKEVERLLGRLKHEGAGPERRGDLRTGLAGPLAIFAVRHVMGLPPEMHGTLREWYDDFAAALANFDAGSPERERGRVRAEEFRRVVRSLLHPAEHDAPSSPVAPLGAPGMGGMGGMGDLTRGARAMPPALPAADAPTLRAATPNDTRGAERALDPRSLLGSLSAPAADRLDDDAICANALIVLFGGIETTEAAILNAAWSLLAHPEQRALVRDEPALLTNAIEESLRWEPAVQTCHRYTTRDLTIDGVTIPSGATVQCMLGAANRDPAHFADPDTFDIRRTNASDHLTFGAGRHFCLGAALARREAHAALSALFARFPRLTLDDERPNRPEGHEFRKPAELWVRW